MPGHVSVNGGLKTQVSFVPRTEAPRVNRRGFPVPQKWLFKLTSLLRLRTFAKAWSVCRALFFLDHPLKLAHHTQAFIFLLGHSAKNVAFLSAYPRL